MRGGAHHLDPVHAATSTLHWAWARRHRPVEDLSHGWGSNSQWDTDFRRDYLLPDQLLCNVDAALTPSCSAQLRKPPREFEGSWYDAGAPSSPPFRGDAGEYWIWDSHHAEANTLTRLRH
jgi:hypothetical protein